MATLSIITSGVKASTALTQPQLLLHADDACICIIGEFGDVGMWQEIIDACVELQERAKRSVQGSEEEQEEEKEGEEK